jgi:hypothetical protein
VRVSESARLERKLPVSYEQRTEKLVAPAVIRDLAEKFRYRHVCRLGVYEIADGTVDSEL